MGSVLDRPEELVVPEEMELWHLWVKLFDRYEREQRFQNMVLQDLVPLHRQERKAWQAWGRAFS